MTTQGNPTNNDNARTSPELSARDKAILAEVQRRRATLIMKLDRQLGQTTEDYIVKMAQKPKESLTHSYGQETIRRSTFVSRSCRVLPWHRRQ